MLDREVREMLVSRSNPVFEYERRKIPWLRDISALDRYASSVWVATTFVVGVIWIVSVVRDKGDTSFQDGLAALLIYVSLFVMVVVDLYSAFTVASNLQRQFTSAQWELIRTSGQSEESVFKAQNAIAQIAAWRPITIEVALRFALIELILLGSFRYWLASNVPVSEMPRDPTILLPAGIMMIVCVLEPGWRLRTLSTLTIAIFTSLKNNAFAFFALFGIIVTVHLVQIGSLVGVWVLIVGSALNHDEGFFDILCCGWPLGVIFSIISTYPLYIVIRNLSFKLAFKRMFAPLDN